MKRKQVLVIHSHLTSLNTYINAERTHWSLAAKIKKNETEYCCEEIMVARLQPMRTPIAIHYHWYIPTKRSDLGNRAFANKFIEDALVKMQIIPDDNITHIQRISHEFTLSSKKGDRQGVDVTLTSLDDDQLVGDN